MFTDMITLERFGSLATYRIDNKKQKQEKKWDVSECYFFLQITIFLR